MSNHKLIDRITLVHGDITKQRDVDAIVTTMQTNMDMDSGLNKAIIKAAGEKLDDFILEHIYKPRIGDVHALPSFKLEIPFIFAAFTPDWRDGAIREDRDLIRCYRNAVDLARRLRLRRIAFPALGMGRQAYPVQRAARLAIQGMQERQTGSLGEIRIVCNRDDLVKAFAARLWALGWQGKVRVDE